MDKDKSLEESKQTHNTISMIFIGGAIVAALLVLTSIWTSHSTQENTDEAVYSVREFYLQELAANGEKVLDTNFDDIIFSMNAALKTIDAENLRSQKNLQEWLTKIETLCNVDEFVFVDENGMAYTAREIEHVALKYNFLAEKIHSPIIRTYNLYEEDKQVVIAIPVENLKFQNAAIVACFVKTGVDKILKGLPIEEDAKTFCSLYYNNGESLTNKIFDEFSRSTNIFSALQKVSFDAGYSYDKVKSDFAEGKTGMVAFTENDTRKIFYYAPVKNTDWLLTCTIDENIISGRINVITEGMLGKSVIQVLIIVAAMTVIFGITIKQARETSRLIHEKEMSETAGRIKQEEMQEKLDLQNKILEEERRRHHQDEMIRALSRDYRSVFYFNLDNDEAICYRALRGSDHKEGDTIPAFSKMFAEYLNNRVISADKEELLKFILPENLRARLKSEKIISYRYLSDVGGRNYYEMIRVAKIDDEKEIHAVGVGIANVDEQTRESMAQNQILADALAQAQHANVSKTTFLSNMSHDIRTPMNAIIGFTSMALRHFENQAQVKDSLEKVLSSSNHLLGLINDILDMSRIDSGRVELQEQECNLSELVHSLIHIIQPQITAKQQIFHIDAFQVKNEYVYADQLKINQVLINILSNAVKYTPATGTISFRISQFDTDEPGHAKYEFRVKDNGMGMSQEFLKHIFDPFERDLSNTKTLGIQGTGLGMTITKKMVELMNGTIEVESEPDKGSEFIVTLDLKLQENVKHLPVSELKGLRALVVDDDFHTCDSVTEILTKLGIKSEWTTSAREAVFRAKKALNENKPFNVYIVDWLMHELNGIETVRQIRRVAGESVPIVFLTAYDYSDVEQEARSAGVTDFCTKPLFMSDLKKALSRAIGTLEREEEKPDDLSLTDFTGKRVLLVEDIEVNREIAKAILSETGLSVEDAPDGTDAVEMFKKSPKNYYDVILMDVQMPKMNGYEATKNIRELQRDDAKKIPIIAMTANAFEEDKVNAINAGMNDHVAKPLDIPKLLETLKKYLH